MTFWYLFKSCKKYNFIHFLTLFNVNNSMSWFYNIPTFWSLMLVLSLSVFFSVLLLYLFKINIQEKVRCGDSGLNFFIYISLLAVFLSVLVSFIIMEVWNGYSSSELHNETEAQAIYNLYQNVYNLPNTKKEQLTIISYLEYIINVEFPMLNSGDITSAQDGLRILQQLQKEIYSYIPKNKQESLLYNNSIEILDRLLQLRIFRLEYSQAGIKNILWATTIIDAILILLMCLTLYCTGPMHYYLVCFFSIYISSSFYIMWIFSYPYRGYSGIKPTAFEDALENIKINDIE